MEIKTNVSNQVDGGYHAELSTKYMYVQHNILYWFLFGLQCFKTFNERNKKSNGYQIFQILRGNG